MTDPIIQTSNLHQTFRALRNNDPLKVQNQVVENHPDYKRVPKNNYAPIATVNTGNWGNSMMRTAAGNTGMIYGQPQFFSPVHTPINWQMPSKRLETYQWQYLPDCQLLTEDYTYETTDNLNINGDVAYDDKTGGKIYDNVKSDAVFSGNGVLTKPSKFSSRQCENKECYDFISYSSYHTFAVSEEHGVYVLDGTWLRRKRKVENNAAYRRSKGIIANGVCKVNIPSELIFRKEAKDVGLHDYLLSPSIPFEIKPFVEGRDKAWMLGLCVADGSISSAHYNTHFTCSKNDKHVSFLHKCLAQTFPDNVVSCQEHHTSDKAVVIKLYAQQSHTFFRKYIVGKLTEKKFTKDIFNLSQEEILNVLGGYFDGDGSYSPLHRTLIANNYSEGMANQIWWMLIKCGIRASIRKYRLTGKHYKTASTHYYKVIVPSSDVPTLLPYMRSGKVPSDFIPKKDRDLSFFYEENGVRYYCRSIRKIKKFLYTGVGYDMQIDVDHSYVLGGAKVSNCRFFYENEPKVASAIDFYSEFSMSGWDHECKDRKVKKYFDKLSKRLDLVKWCRLISHELHMLGDCFPMVEISCEQCNNTGKIGDMICEHEGGTVRRVIILNPDFVEVFTPPLNPNPIIALKADEDLVNMVQRKTPGIEKLTPQVVKLIASGQPIPLDNRNVGHLKYGECPYTKFGIGMIRRLFPILSYKTKLMVAQWIVAERLILPIKIVKVGSDERPAGPADIAAVQAQLAQTANDPNLTIVTHHAFELDWAGANGKILTISNEFEIINQEILDGLMINNALLNGEGPSFGNASVGIEAMIQRLKTFRSQISDWIEKFIYLPEARRQGFVTKDPDTGEDEYIVPKIKWHKMHLRDEQQQRTFVMQLYEKGLLSAPTVLEAFEYDPDNEIERKRYDMVQNLALGQGQGGQGAPGMGGGGGGGGMMPPMGDMGGGGAPGGDMGGGMPGAPGGAPGGDMGGGAPGGAPVVAKASSLSAQTVDPNQFGGRVLKRRTRERLQSEQVKVFRQQQRMQQPVGRGQQQRDEKGRIIYTKPERMLMEKLIQAQRDGLIRYHIQPQFRVTAGEKEYPLDFAIPQLKIGIEADGEMFHGQPDQEAKDKARDMVLGQQGWTIARFKDYEIEDYPQKVLQTIIQNIMQKEIYVQQQAATLKQAQTEAMEREAKESEDIIQKLAASNETITSSAST